MSGLHVEWMLTKQEAMKLAQELIQSVSEFKLKEPETGDDQYERVCLVSWGLNGPSAFHKIITPM